MAVCTNCGHESAEEFRFCPECGAPASVEARREQRKTVTVLFCDVTGSTALGESTDPEALRALLARYFERMKGIVESHGGTVEKFIGDAVMAVFGVPVVHEDDALRAVRAAVEMREALPELGVEARIGVNTGEVVTGTEERLATGDAVNVAARLEQAAQPGEVLLGEPTLRLVRGAVEVEPAERLELKGKSEPVPAYRLLGVRAAPERRHETMFVGRERELAILREAWERAQAERRCELVTLVGDAGVGKSRLAAEFLASADVRVVRGRCLSYGRGITYWPVVEVLRQLDALPSDPAAAASLRSLLRESDQGTSAEEIAWAFRKLLEEQAPLVCLLEDIHWGEETFLDLVEHLALLAAGAPILLLCLARPELSERRPSWPIAMHLERLPQRDVQELIPESMDEELRTQITVQAGGNPLFVTEMVAMAGETEGGVVVPPTLQALLAARLDQLEAPERSVLERGAVEGEIFHRGAVQALSQDGQVTPRLASLVRKELIRPDKAQLPAEDAFRFRHLLIRDAAYDALTKATRAELHERFADWLEERGHDLVELDEILGYHLEQAARYQEELGQPDPELAQRAGERLAAAGRRASWRGDLRAAAPLLERALELLRPLRLDIHVELEFADALNDPERALEITEEAARRARDAGDEASDVLARLRAAGYRLQLGTGEVEEVEALSREALAWFEQLDDHAGLARVWTSLGIVASFRARNEDVAVAAENYVREAGLAGWHSRSLGGLGDALVFGPRPADEALRILDSAMPPSPHPAVLMGRASLLAMLARFDEAWSLAGEASERWRELTGISAVGTNALAEIATLVGDHEAAAGYLQAFCDYLEVRGGQAYLSTYAPALGRSLCELGRYDEAEPLAQRGRELGAEQDVMTQMLWRQVQALVHAHRGESDAAERLVREAVAIAERTDGLNHQGNTLCDLAEVLDAAGRTDEAVAALEQALECYERKKNLAMVAQVRPQLEALREEARA